MFQNIVFSLLEHSIDSRKYNMHRRTEMMSLSRGELIPFKLGVNLMGGGEGDKQQQGLHSQ